MPQDSVVHLLGREAERAGLISDHRVVLRPGVKHAAELWKDGAPKVLVALWEDGSVTSCVVKTNTSEEVCCHTTEPGQGEELLYAWQAHLTSPEVGYKIKSVEVEE